MGSRRREILYALAAIVLSTAVYLVAYSQARAFPGPSGLVGHGIGVLGFVLMLMTETLYSIRKRATDARWGSVASWLRFHIVTGLVGPYMVLLHTAMRFRGLAGLTMLLTIVVAVSGVVGRYIYTAIPRVLDVAEPISGSETRQQLAEQLAAQRNALASWHAVHVPLTWALFTLAFIHAGAALYYATFLR